MLNRSFSWPLKRSGCDCTSMFIGEISDKPNVLTKNMKQKYLLPLKIYIYILILFFLAAKGNWYWHTFILCRLTHALTSVCYLNQTLREPLLYGHSWILSLTSKCDSQSILSKHTLFFLRKHERQIQQSMGKSNIGRLKASLFSFCFQFSLRKFSPKDYRLLRMRRKGLRCSKKETYRYF